MNFDEFISSPADFLDKLIKDSDFSNDFDIQKTMEHFFGQNIELVNSIPLITNIKDVRSVETNTLVRLRVSQRCPCSRVYIDLKTITDKGIFSYFSYETIPNDAIVQDVVHFEVNPCICELSINYSDWVNDYQTNFRINKDKVDNKEKTYVTIYHLHDSIKFSKLIDVIGILNTDFNLTSSILNFTNSFIEIASFPVNVIYKPELPLFKDDFFSMRNVVLSVLGSMFDDITSNFLLLFLLSRTTGIVGALNLGIFSLNIYGLEKDEAYILSNFLAEICTCVTRFEINAENLNNVTLMPIIKDDSITETIFNTHDENRFIFVDNLLDRRGLNEKGYVNLDLIQQLSISQIISYDMTDVYQNHVSNPVLILSFSKSNITCDIHIKPKRKVLNSLPDISDEQLEILRNYFDKVRFLNYQLSENDNEIIYNGILEYRKRRGTSGQQELHILTILATIFATSCGAQRLTEEIWEEVSKMMLSSLSN